MHLDELAKQLNAFESVDESEFQRRARVLQSIWRQEQSFDMGIHKGKKPRPLGSRLLMPWARESLANYLTEGIRGVVWDEVLDPEKSKGKLYKKPRIFNDLLSSQPLCFNLFGELTYDLELASRVVSRLTGERFTAVETIEFEDSPGRGDPQFTGDHSAFDVLIKGRTRGGGLGFLGIEVKYHENLKNTPRNQKNETRARYREVAEEMGCFKDPAADAFWRAPLHQIWRDHLLAGSMLPDSSYDDGVFVFLYPRDNEYCSSAVAEYRRFLADEESFVAWTLEDVVTALKTETDAAWAAAFRDRYLAFDKIERYLNRD